MAKHRRWSDKPKNDPPAQKNEEPELIQKDIPSKKETTDIKSLFLSGTKYVYIVAIAALASGIFTPFTYDGELETVISGVLILLIGVGGGILIFIGNQREKHSKILVLAGLSFIIISLFLMFVIAKGIII